ncbi:MAG: shikimate kinase [Clostridia bacterium]|nr:shikimate kinase [Clostridia bacterium]
MNLVLCGMMGSGKTTVGKALAKFLNCAQLDTDDVISSRHGKITDIFAQCGESYFRALETELARELSTKENLVISTGGGFVLNADNVALLKTNGKIIFLRARLETLESRLIADENRPLLHSSNEPLKDKLSRLIQARYPVYEAASDCIVEVDEKSADEIAKEIMSIM